MNWQIYSKFIAAFSGVLIPFLNQTGVPLPPFLTVDWVNGLLLALTPVAVFWFANRPKGEPRTKQRMNPLPVIFLPLIMLGGCTTLGYGDVDIDTTRKAIVVANAELKAANLLLQDLLDRNAVSATNAQKALDELNKAHDTLQRALDAVDTSGDPFTAGDLRLQPLRAIDIAMRLLAPSVEEPT